ncbi:phospholipase [Sphingosinithalassobacter tenebrarum]|uniref:Phospholipase A1 n=1 Tax=Stakelama tenebrarum TaxID=2711215 RepID=A0A6G6Y9Z1_9SPHN|nr:phospholipase [Sphingosinithalassobacter tenebrarum]
MAPLLIAPFLIAAPAAAQLRTVPVQPASEREALRGVEVYLLNESDAPQPIEAPRQIELTAADGTKLILERVPAPDRTVEPGGFAKLRYVPVGLAGTATPPAAAWTPAPDAPEGETVVASSTGSSAALLDRFEPHEPIYAAWGPEEAGIKMQFSFAFKPFVGETALRHLRVAYTQTMYWDFDAPSGPFRATDYSPEVYAQVPVGDATQIAFGYRHDSNGRDIGSKDVNRIFGRVEQRFDLGEDWRLDVAPMAWVYFAHQGSAPDIEDYRGYTALTAAVTQVDGIRLAVTGRGNFNTGNGAVEGFLSYPLTRIDSQLGGYLFVQGFHGEGEWLDRYDVTDTQLRFGIAFTR